MASDGKRKCPENVQEQEVKQQKTARRSDILITVDAPQRLSTYCWAWQFGEAKTWKSLKDESPTYRVNYSNSTSKIHEMLGNMVCVDTTKFDEVMATMKWEGNRWKFTKRSWPHECQRFLLEAFDEEFSNSAGRNCLQSLLKTLVEHVEESPVLNIYNVGGGSTKNKKLRKMTVQYNFYSPDPTSWTESSSSKNSSPENSSPEKSSHTPVMDCMVWGPETSQAYLVAEVKAGLLRPEDCEQHRHQLLSQLSLVSPHCRLVGVLICYLEAQLFICAKDPKEINIIEVNSYKFTEGDHKGKFSNFLRDMVKLLQACHTKPNFPLV